MVAVDDGEVGALAGDELDDLLGGVAGEFVEDGLVDVAGDAGVAVAESLGDDLDVDASGEHEGGGDVAKVVEADGREAGGAYEAVEEVGDLAGVEDAAVFFGEDAAGVLPAVSPGGFLLFLA